MDIRISAYSSPANAFTVSRFGGTGGNTQAVAVQSANNAGPVEAVRPVAGAGNALNQQGAVQAAKTAEDTPRVQANNEGRGKIVDIYA